MKKKNDELTSLQYSRYLKIGLIFNSSELQPCKLKAFLAFIHICIKGDSILFRHSKFSSSSLLELTKLQLHHQPTNENDERKLLPFHSGILLKPATKIKRK